MARDTSHGGMQGPVYRPKHRVVRPDMIARRSSAFAYILVPTLLFLAGCAILQEPINIADPPRAELLPAGAGKRPLVALVLSRGSARGFAHIGVIKVLEEAGIEPDIVVGSSVGSIVGVAYAAGMDARQLAPAAQKLDGAILQDLTLPNLGVPMRGGELGVIRGERLQNYIDRLVSGCPVQALPRRIAVVATDLQSGLPVAFTHGNAGLAVRASSSVPGVLVPPLVNGRLYVDGQVSSPVPVTVARRLGADIVIAVDVTFPSDHADIANTASVLFQSFTIATQRIKDHELGQATVVIRPDIKTSGQLGLSDRDWLIDAGDKAARAALPVLQAIRVAGSGKGTTQNSSLTEAAR